MLCLAFGCARDCLKRKTKQTSLAFTPIGLDALLGISAGLSTSTNTVSIFSSEYSRGEE